MRVYIEAEEVFPVFEIYTNIDNIRIADTYDIDDSIVARWKYVIDEFYKVQNEIKKLCCPDEG